MQPFAGSVFSELDDIPGLSIEEAISNDPVSMLPYNIFDDAWLWERIPEDDTTCGSESNSEIMFQGRKLPKKPRTKRFGRRRWSLQPPTLWHPIAIATTKDDKICYHCGTMDTPQWRRGPAGVQTLCNACGIRFKSGRLLPEYRPLASPNYINTDCSNRHNMVMKIRGNKRQK
ncbi:GATA transcription factor 3-like [Curcuma longa]|uniref:GATA transcription factor 3-like n=1 Tax=Curcuma longa TaxID=136217 RepID=UPI003D9E32A3